MNKGKLELFNNNVETILSKENNEVFYDNSNYVELFSTDQGTIKTNIKVEPQVSIYDIMKSWCDLQQKCKDGHERFYDYYFDDETNTTYRLTNIYISNAGGHYDKEVKLLFNYDDKKEVWHQSDDEINSFFETYINASNIQGDAKIENKYCKAEK